MGTICLPFREVRTKIYIPKITFVLKSEVSLPSPKRTGNGLKLNPEYYRLNRTMYYLDVVPEEAEQACEAALAVSTLRGRGRSARRSCGTCASAGRHLVARVVRHLAVENSDRGNHTT
jgi:hypothetical protein